MDKPKRLGVYTHEMNRVQQHQARLQTAKSSSSYKMNPSMDTNAYLANQSQQLQQDHFVQSKDKYHVCHMDIAAAAAKARYVQTPIVPAAHSQRTQSLMQQQQQHHQQQQQHCVTNATNLPHIRQPQQQLAQTQINNSNNNYATILPHNMNNCNNNNNNGKQNHNNVHEHLSGTLLAKMKPRNKNEEAVNDLLVRIPDVDRTFDVHSRIGNGTFSTVLLATLKRERSLPESARRKFAIKHHIPTSHPDRIMKELQCMKKMGGINNVVGINCCIRCEASVAFIMPYMQHDRFHEFFTKMKPTEVRFYMRNLLIALRHVHKFGIIHRDVKPSNFLYNRRMQQFLLVDFGLAQHVPNATTGATTQPQQQQQQQQLAALETAEAPSGISNQKRMRENDDLQDGGGGGCGPSTAKRCRLRAELSNNNVQNASTTTTIATTTTTKMPLKQINVELSEMPAPECKVHEANKTTLAEQQQQQQQQQQEASDMTAVPLDTSTTTTTTTNVNKYNTNRNSNGTHNLNKCYCYGNSTVCNVCLVKKEVHASRAGTPGYRPPEVLLKYADQTTAVDVWAAGVIFLSILSSVYPFFKAPSDYIALAEIITIFGDKTIRKTAFALDRLLTLSQRAQPLDIHKLCVRFRNRAIFSSSEMLKRHQQPDGSCDVCKNCDQYFFNCLCLESQYKTEPCAEYDIFPTSAYDLLHRLLEVNPHKRITADEALKHPFLCETTDDAAIKTDAAAAATAANVA